VKRLLALALALGAIAAATTAAAAADAQSTSSGVFIGIETGGRIVSTIETRLRVKGAVTVDFHGDEASGCAATGLCEVSGSVTWDPSGAATLLSYGYRLHGQRYEGGFLSLGRDNPFEDVEPTTAARVRRAGGPDSGGGLCADAATQLFAGIGIEERPGSSLRLALAGTPDSGIPFGDVFRTRCAGPDAADFAAALPVRTVSERALRRGGGRLDFSADQPFSAGGLAGTVHSTVVFHLGESTDLDVTQQPDEPVDHVVRRRAVDASYKLESVSGQIVTGMRGLADPDLCGPLDACGLMGDVTTAPSASAGEAYLTATASLRHSGRDLSRALGLVPGPRPGGVARYGYASWNEDSGTVTSSLTREGGGGCTDSHRLSGPGIVTLQFQGDSVRASYGQAESLPEEPLRTRCPGPNIADVAASRPLAAATVPLSTFRARRVTLRLRTGAAFRAEGYSGRTQPDLTVVLRRVGVRHYIQRFDIPSFAKVLARRLP
jgi:hypothetical protein